MPATSHWFEFTADDPSATMIVEAAHGATIRLYKEIPLPSLDDLPDIADIYGQSPPVISTISVLAVEKGIFLAAKISWHTDRPTSSRLTYGIKDLRQVTPLNRQLTTEHLATLSDLAPDRTYQFMITAEDAIGNRSESDILRLSTAATFSNPARESAAIDCCIAAPLGLESHFYRKGDQYMVNFTIIRPVKMFFTLRTDGKVKAETQAPDDRPTPKVIKHEITNPEEFTTLRVCRTCHRNFSNHHPVNIYPKKHMIIPDDYPTMAGGKLSCTSCHAPHASDFPFLMRKDHNRDLCVGCHSKL